MNNLYDRDSEDPDTGEREISLGTSTILGIFFALALVCAVFFGFGYSMGRRSAQPLASAATDPVATAGLNTAKPTASSALPIPSQQPADTPDPNSNSATGATTAIIPDALPVATASQPTAKPVSLPHATPPPATAAPGAATAIVQVAAVSHQEDADLLLAALKKRGYTVAVHQEPQDKLLHVQLGPFATKKDADAMRQRLLTDGYNAIVK